MELENIGWHYYVLECCFILILIIIIYFSFVETHGNTLEEMAVIFDGEENFANMAATVGAEMEKHDHFELENAVEATVAEGGRTASE